MKLRWGYTFSSLLITVCSCDRWTWGLVLASFTTKHSGWGQRRSVMLRSHYTSRANPNAWWSWKEVRIRDTKRQTVNEMKVRKCVHSEALSNTFLSSYSCLSLSCVPDPVHRPGYRLWMGEVKSDLEASPWIHSSFTSVQCLYLDGWSGGLVIWM